MNKIIKKRIVQILRQDYERALKQYEDVQVEWAACVASANMWDDLNPEHAMSGIRQNPYNVNSANIRVMETKTYLSISKQAYDYAVDTFLDGDKNVDQTSA